MNVLVNEGRRWFLISVAESDSAPSLSRTSAERGGGAEEKTTSNPLFLAVLLLHLKGVRLYLASSRGKKMKSWIGTHTDAVIDVARIYSSVLLMTRSGCTQTGSLSFPLQVV